MRGGHSGNACIIQGFVAKPYNCSYLFLQARLEKNVSIETSNSLFDEGIEYYLLRVSHANHITTVIWFLHQILQLSVATLEFIRCYIVVQRRESIQSTGLGAGVI